MLLRGRQYGGVLLPPVGVVATCMVVLKLHMHTLEWRDCMCVPAAVLHRCIAAKSTLNVAYLWYQIMEHVLQSLICLYLPV
jgi:hypothetical protein